MATVHQHRETYGARTSVVDQGVHRGSDRPAGEEHVVDEHDDPFVDGEWDLRLAHDRRVADSGQVVAVERDVDGPERDLGALVRPYRRLDARRERVAARANTDDGESGEVAIALHDLVRDPRDGPADILRREQRGRLALLPGLTGPVLKGGGARPSIGVWPETASDVERAAHAVVTKYRVDLREVAVSGEKLDYLAAGEREPAKLSA